jgi:cytidylate kinase
MRKIIIAIDGFSSCGKSTMAKALARNIGYLYFDSGAMYRAVALFCMQNGLIADGNIDKVALLENIKNIMEGLKYTAQQAMELLKIPADDQPKYLAKL